jgi:hypothetical protein
VASGLPARHDLAGGHHPGVPAAVAQIQHPKDPTVQSGSIIVVDKVVKPCYTMHMNLEKPSRKKRADRNHIVYELEVNGLNYIGVTAKTESTVLKSVRARAAKHFYRAKTESKNWLLCEALRSLNSKDEIEIKIHAIIRGKAEAHKEEVKIRRAIKPVLNTDTRGD